MAEEAEKRMERAEEALVEVVRLTKDFDVSPPLLTRLLQGQQKAFLRAVDAVSFTIPRGRTFSLVGESGCGKSTLARLVVDLYSPTSGHVFIDGKELARLRSRRAQAEVRRRLQMIFQDPFASLNPRWRVRDIIAEPIRAHRLMSDRGAINRRVGELLELVRLTPADGMKYPHEFSGGQRQRIGIARALYRDPPVLFFDEATSALDAETEGRLNRAIEALAQDKTVIVIAHRQSTLNSCRQVLTLAPPQAAEAEVEAAAAVAVPSDQGQG